MGMDVGGNRGAVRSDINITPLVDVVLVLLIIFMVVTPMLQRGKHVELPSARHVASAGGNGEPDPLFVTVMTNGDVYVETEKVSLDALPEKLKEGAALGKRIMVKADAETEYGKIRPMLDKASKAKLKGVSLAATEIKEEKK